MLWDVDTQSSSIIFSKISTKGDAGWVDIYDWCNATFNSNDWDFWYDGYVDDSGNNKVKIYFRFLQEHNAVEFQMKWG